MATSETTQDAVELLTAGHRKVASESGAHGTWRSAR